MRVFVLAGLLGIATTACGPRQDRQPAPATPVPSDSSAPATPVPSDPSAPSVPDDVAPLLGELRLPSAAHGLELLDAPDVVVTRNTVYCSGYKLSSVRSLHERGRVTPLPSLIGVLVAVREHWMTLNPKYPSFHGVALLWIDENTPALAVKNVVLSVAAAGYPNQAFVVRRSNAPSAYGRIFVDGRVSAAWGREPRNEAELYVELGGDDSARLSWRAPGGTLGTPNTVSLTELPLAIEREWKAHGAHTAESDPEFDRATVSILDTTNFALMLRVFDALAKPRRNVPVGDTKEALPAFEATIAVPEDELPQFLVR
jgi:hypothetical protein